MTGEVKKSSTCYINTKKSEKNKYELKVFICVAGSIMGHLMIEVQKEIGTDDTVGGSS